jgi:serine/threonine protein kinase
MTDNSGPKIGAVLGKYRITRQIGRGGMATIFAAENVDIGKAVAVKVLSRDLADSRTVTERFLREARAAAKLTSPHICEVYDVGTVDERPFIVMELLQGESLYDRLARERRLPLADVISITTQVGKGLSKAHSQQIVHRDLKPENIFLTVTEDGQPVAKLVDFGLAKFYEPHQDPASARLTKEGALFGTPAYMSPEQAKAKNNVDQRSDLWALGCIVYEMLTGRTVWDVEQGVAMILAQVANGVAPEPRKYRPDLPPAFSDWFKRALARNVDERFQSADELALQLRAALSDETPNDRDTLGYVYDGPADDGGQGLEGSNAQPGPPRSPLPPPKPPPPLLEPSSNAPAIVAARPTRRRRWWWLLPVAAALAGSAWFALTEFAPSSSAQAEVGAAGEPVGRAQQQLLAGDSEGDVAIRFRQTPT